MAPPKEEVKKCINEYFQVSGNTDTTGPCMVKFFVGPERKLWILLEHLLSDRIKFFKSAFQSGFQESKEKVLELPSLRQQQNSLRQYI